MKSVLTAAWRYLEGATEMRPLACSKQRDKAAELQARNVTHLSANHFTFISMVLLHKTDNR